MSLGTGDMAEAIIKLPELNTSMQKVCLTVTLTANTYNMRADMTDEVHLIFVSLQLTMLPLQMLPQRGPVIISSPS